MDLKERQGKTARETDSNGTAPTRAQLFMRAAVGDFLLVLVVSVGLVLAVSYAFNSVPDVRGNVLVVAAIAIPLLAVLFAGSWSKRAIAPACAGAIAYAVVVIAACTALTPSNVPLFVDAQINDDPESPLIFGVVALVVPAAVYLLSRRRAGVIVLLVAAVIALGSVQFLYRDWATAEAGVPVSLVVIAALFALLVFQSYRTGVRQVKRVCPSDVVRGCDGACVRGSRRTRIRASHRAVGPGYARDQTVPGLLHAARYRVHGRL